MTYEEWIDEYLPIPNHIVDSAAYDGLMFETYGDELEHVRNTPNEFIWTLLDEDGHTWIANGFYFVNRMGYFITEKPAPDELLEIVIGEPYYRAADGNVLTDDGRIICTAVTPELAEQIVDALNMSGEML